MVLQSVSDSLLDPFTDTDGKTIVERAKASVGEVAIQMLGSSPSVVTLVADENPMLAVFDPEILQKEFEPVSEDLSGISTRTRWRTPATEARSR